MKKDKPETKKYHLICDLEFNIALQKQGKDRSEVSEKHMMSDNTRTYKGLPVVTLEL